MSRKHTAFRRIIVTVGTSVVAGHPPLKSAEDVPHRVRERLNELTQKHPEGDHALEILSAETNSLLKFGITHSDEIDLVCTDTPFGDACGRALAGLIEKRVGAKPNVVTIKGLQVDDAHIFRTQGIQNLFKWLDDTLGSQRFSRDKSVVLNVTGGFKSVVPYVTLYGILRRFPVIYLFERSKELITLPPFPLYYDEGLVNRAQKALAALQDEGVMSREKLYGLIRDFNKGEEMLFESFFEADSDNQMTLSAFGQLLLEDADLDALPVELSAEAEATYQNASGSRRDFLDTLLYHLKQPGWLDTHFHQFNGTDLDVVKPGRTPARAAGFRKGKTFRVCLLFPDHDVYERELGGRSRSEFEGVSFSPWVPPSAENAAPKELEDILQKQERAYQQLRKDQNDMEKMLSESEAAHSRTIENLKSEMHENQRCAESRISELEGSLERAQAESVQTQPMREKIEALQQQLEGNDRAWQRCRLMDRLRFLFLPKTFVKSRRPQQKDL